MPATKTVRRKNYRTASVGPQYPTFAEARITCCSCWESFGAGSIGGTYLARTCPRCGAELSMDAYDAAHARLDEDIVALRSRVEAARTLYKKWESRSKALDGHRVLRWFVGGFVERRKDDCHSSLVDVASGLSIAEHRKGTIAASRYYVSEWHLSTRMPLKLTDAKGKPIHSFRPCYCGKDEAGHSGRPAGFRLSYRPSDTASKGLAGEWELACAIEHAARDEQSPLFRARIVSNIFLIKEGLGVPRGRSPWMQIDMLVITTRGIVVVEVKHREAEVVVDQHVGEAGGAWWRPGRSIAGSSSFVRKDLLQVVAHWDAVVELAQDIPVEAILAALVYVRPKKFYTSSTGFVDDLLVAELSQEASPETDVVRQLETRLAEMPEILGRDEVDALSQFYQDNYGDPLGHKTYLHTGRITR